MNNLTINHSKTPFSFLTIPQPTKSYSSNNCGLAWITNRFYLQGNYFIYTCHSCSDIQIKPGTKSKEILNWGGQDV